MPLTTPILQVPFDPQLEPMPRIVVVAADRIDDDDDLLAHYVSASSVEGACQAESAIATIIRSERLNSPDRITVTGVERRPGGLRVEVQIQRYAGPMAANDPWFALISLEFGLPKAGVNEVLLSETTREFADSAVGEPIRVGNVEHRLRFTCLG